MEIITPPEFYSTINNCHLLLDTSVFIDALINPTTFGEFFNELRDHNVTLVTIDPVILEFIKGAPNYTKHQEKLEFLNSIIDTCLPLPKEVFEFSKKLSELYNEEGKTVSITDFLLGACIGHYQNNLFLISKNTSDFPTNIFQLKTFLNLVHRKSIQSYGVYSYSNP